MEGAREGLREERIIMAVLITNCIRLMILLAGPGVLVGIGRVAVVGITSTVMNPLVPELVAIVVAKGRERERER